MKAKEEPQEDTNATRAAEPSQVSEASFIAAARDVDPEATLIDGRAKKVRPQVPVRPVVEDDEPEATRIDSKPPVAARAPVAPEPIEEDDDEATRIDPKGRSPSLPVAAPALAPSAVRAPSFPKQLAVPDPPAAALPRPPARSIPMVWLLVLAMAVVLLVFVAVLRATHSGPRPEDMKPLRSVEVQEEKGLLRSIFDW